MSNALTPFDFEGNPVRVVMIDDQPRFVVNDVCRVLTISDPRSVIQRITSKYVGQTHVLDGRGLSRLTNVVNEPGLYELIFRSDKPEAARFREWVFEEVLPAIRRDGGYVRPDATSGQRDALASRITRDMETLALGKGIVDPAWLDARGREVLARGLQFVEVSVPEPEPDEDELPDVTPFLGQNPGRWVKEIPGLPVNAKLQDRILQVLADHAGAHGLREAAVRALVVARWYVDKRGPDAANWHDAWRRITGNKVTCSGDGKRWALTSH